MTLRHATVEMIFLWMFLSVTAETASADWPVIHQNDLGTKESPFPGPEGILIRSEAVSMNAPVLMLQGNGYLYYQTNQSTWLYAFDPEDIGRGPVFETNTGASFPRWGGGILDNQGNSWWSMNGRLVRVDASFEKADSSWLYGVDSVEMTVMANGLTLLAPGRFMATTFNQYAWIMSTDKDPATGQYPILDTIDFQAFTFGDQFPWENETVFNPRPVMDDSGFVYIPGGSWLGKLRYDTAAGKLDRELVWGFRNPNAQVTDFTLSNAVILNDHVCISTTAGNGSYQDVYVVDRYSGEQAAVIRAFPEAQGRDAKHTLGAIQSSNSLFIIGNSPDGDAGVAGYDLDTFEPLWPFVPLKNIGEAFVVSSGNNRVYISYSEDSLSPFKIASIDIGTGETRDIYVDSTITENPRGHLALLSETGLYYPTPDGFVRLWDGDETSLRHGAGKKLPDRPSAGFDALGRYESSPVERVNPNLLFR